MIIVIGLISKHLRLQIQDGNEDDDNDYSHVKGEYLLVVAILIIMAMYISIIISDD